MQHTSLILAARQETYRNLLLAIAASLVLHACIVFVAHAPGFAHLHLPDKSLKLTLRAFAKETPASPPPAVQAIPARPGKPDIVRPTTPPKTGRISSSPGSTAPKTTGNTTDTPTAPIPDTEKPDAPKPSIQADSINRVARQIARETRASAEAQGKHLERPEEKESPLTREVEKNAPKDCRTAYANLGLLAVPFLLRDSVSTSGCRWHP